MSQQVNVGRALRFTRDGTGGNDACAIQTMQCYNASAGALVAGDVVVLDPANCTADRIAVKTSTTANDRLAWGMAVEAIATTTFGEIQIWGPTALLKVQGTTDITIGDAIGHGALAGLGAKSASGGGGFAMALEAYASDADTGVIDAWIAGGAYGFAALVALAAPNAFVQASYSTALATVAAMVATTADYGAGGTFGFTTTGAALNLATSVNNLRQDVESVKKNLNTVIDELQAKGLLG